MNYRPAAIAAVIDKRIPEKWKKNIFAVVKYIEMPKSAGKTRNGAAKSSPYAHAAVKTKAANNIFKMNTDLGQHVLKNPGVAQAIVDKADLRGSDVSYCILYLTSTD